MTWIADQIGADVPIYITENGFSDLIGNLDDLHREYYYKHYINQLLKGKTGREKKQRTSLSCKESTGIIVRIGFNI